MKLTSRGQKVIGFAFIVAMLSFMALAGRFDAMDQCATFQANNDYQSAIDAGCSFAPNADGEYSYTWTP